MEVSESLKRFRKWTGLNQEEMATKLGVKRQAYQPYETGKVKPSVDMVLKMAKVFGVSADYLLGLSDEPQPVKYDADEIKKAFVIRDMFKESMTKIAAEAQAVS